ncbi:hypothetical protein GGX14DRAFT_372142, partial [Mycena pura]
DMVLPMNTGAEAVETAPKLARKWAYTKKGVPEGRAVVLSAEANFHGRTAGAIRCVVWCVPVRTALTRRSMSTDPDSRAGFGPYLLGVGAVLAGRRPYVPRRRRAAHDPLQ